MYWLLALFSSKNCCWPKSLRCIVLHHDPCYVARCCDLLLWNHSLAIQFIPINMHTVFALLCFVVVIHRLIFPYPSGLLHWHCGNLAIAPVPAKQPWWIWINTSCEFIMNDCITTTKQSTTKPCAYFLGYTVANSHQASSTSINTLLTTWSFCYSNFRREEPCRIICDHNSGLVNYRGYLSLYIVCNEIIIKHDITRHTLTLLLVIELGNYFGVDLISASLVMNIA